MRDFWLKFSKKQNFEFSNIAKKRRRNANFDTGVCRGDYADSIKINKRFKTLARDRFRDFLEICKNFIFLKIKLEKFIGTISCRITIYINILNFRALRINNKEFGNFRGMSP